MRFTLDVKQGGGPRSQFYLMDIGSCWKNNGKPCDGNVTTDVTRYSEMILNPTTETWCNAAETHLCPPYHTFLNGTRVHRSNVTHFPYDAYHLHCSPGNANFWKSLLTFATHIVTRRLRRYFKLCPTPFGESTATRLRKVRGGLVIQKHGILMLGGFLRTFTSIRLIHFLFHVLLLQFTYDVDLYNGKIF